MNASAELYSLAPVLPELVLLVGAMVLLMLGVFWRSETETIVNSSAVVLLALYLGLELMSLALYVLAASNRDSVRSTEAGLKYFVLGALSSGMLLYGASLIYGFSGTVSFAGIAQASSQAGLGLTFGLVFLFAGFCF